MTDWPKTQREVSERIVVDALRLHKNGYEPIPIITKVPAQIGWQKYEITPELIHQKYGGAFWPTCRTQEEIAEAKRLYSESVGRFSFCDDKGLWRTKRWADGIGVRVRDFGAVDADVNCPFMQTVIADILRQHLGDDWWHEHPLRFGNGAKSMRFGRISSSDPVPSTARLVKPGDDPEDADTKTHRVEVFPGVLNPHTGHPIRQVGVVGQCGRDTSYRFEDNHGLLQVALHELPPFDRDALVRALVEIEGEMWAAGWVEKPKPMPGHASHHGAGRVMYRDLTRDQMVMTLGRGFVRVEELRPGDRVRMLEITGEGTREDRGSVFIDEWGVGIFDFEEEAIHRVVASDSPGDWDSLSALGEKLQLIAPRPTAAALARRRGTRRPRAGDTPPPPVADVNLDRLALRLEADMHDPFQRKLGKRFYGTTDGLRRPTPQAYDISLARMLAGRGYTYDEIVAALWEFSPLGIAEREGRGDGERGRVERIAAAAVAKRDEARAKFVSGSDKRQSGDTLGEPTSKRS